MKFLFIPACLDWFPVSDDHVDALKAEFPGVDVEGQLVLAWMWLDERHSEGKMKVLKEKMPEFLRNWMRRNQG